MTSPRRRIVVFAVLAGILLLVLLSARLLTGQVMNDPTGFLRSRMGLTANTCPTVTDAGGFRTTIQGARQTNDLAFDANGDGTVTVSDAILLSTALLHLRTGCQPVADPAFSFLHVKTFTAPGTPDHQDVQGVVEGYDPDRHDLIITLPTETIRLEEAREIVHVSGSTWLFGLPLDPMPSSFVVKAAIVDQGTDTDIVTEELAYALTDTPRVLSFIRSTQNVNGDVEEWVTGTIAGYNPDIHALSVPYQEFIPTSLQINARTDGTHDVSYRLRGRNLQTSLIIKHKTRVLLGTSPMVYSMHEEEWDMTAGMAVPPGVLPRIVSLATETLSDRLRITASFLNIDAVMTATHLSPKHEIGLDSGTYHFAVEPGAGGTFTIDLNHPELAPVAGLPGTAGCMTTVRVFDRLQGTFELAQATRRTDALCSADVTP